MIDYNDSSRIFQLTNKSISYIIYLNTEGILETLYFGKAIKGIDDPEPLRRSNEWHDSSFYYDNVEGKECKYGDGFKNNSAPLEIGSHGLFDKRFAPIIVKRPNGSYETDFRYQDHHIYNGMPSISELPHVRNAQNFTTLEFYLKEVETDVYLRYYIAVAEDNDVIVKWFTIENQSEKDIRVLRAMSMQLDLRSPDYKLVHFRGRWQKEREYVENDLIDGIQEISSNYGRSSHEENPFVFLKAQNADTDHGEVIGFNLIYSGNFKFRIHLSYARSPHVTYGINDEDFEWKLIKGDSFTTPQAVIAYSYSGVDGMSQAFHKFIKANILSAKDKLPKRIPFNSWEGCFFDFDTQTVVDYIDDGVKIGTELFVLDDGWFGDRNSDNAGLGDWQVNRDKIDLHAIIDHCKEKGIAFGIWFEPEMINYDSNLYRAHPEYVLADNTSKTLTCIRHQFHLDFANPKVVDNVYKQLKTFLDEYDIDYIKWDCNRIIEEHYSKVFTSARQGEIYHRVILGYYNLLGRIADEYPDILIEGCASGGGRFDLGTLYYTPQIWASDESDPAQRMEINYNTSLGYPISTIGAHVNASPIGTYKTKAILALFGTYGYEMNPNKLSQDDMDALSEIADVYHKYHSSVIENGKLYHLLDPNKTNWMAMQCVDRQKDVSLIVVMNRKKELDRYRYLKLKGLDPDAKYYNDYENAVLTGEYLMNIGINLSNEWCDEFTCRLITVTKAK